MTITVNTLLPCLGTVMLSEGVEGCCGVCMTPTCRYKSVGKLSSGHQATIMKLAIDDTDTADGNICVVTGAKDHYIKVCLLRCHLTTVTQL